MRVVLPWLEEEEEEDEEEDEKEESEHTCHFKKVL